MFVNDFCRPGPLLFIHFRCLAHRPHYYAWPIRFGSRVPSEEVRALSFPLLSSFSPRIRHRSELTEKAWDKGVLAGTWQTILDSFSWPREKPKSIVFSPPYFAKRRRQQKRKFKINKQNKTIALVSKTTLHLHRAFCLLRRNDEILSFLKHVKGKAITFAVSKART